MTKKPNLTMAQQVAQAVVQVFLLAKERRRA